MCFFISVRSLPDDVTFTFSQKKLVFECGIDNDFTTYYSFNVFVLFSFSRILSYFFTGSRSSAVRAATTPHFYKKRAEIIGEKGIDEKKNSTYGFYMYTTYMRASRNN